MTTIFFASENYIKSIAAISANININLIMPYVQSFQDMNVQEVLGSNYYYQLINSFSAGTLNPEEVVLVEKIRPYLAWGAAEQSLATLTYRITNKGPQLQFGDNSTQITLEELKYLRNDFKQKVNFYENRLKNFLCLSGSVYPGFITNNNTDILPNKDEAFIGDIYTYKQTKSCSNCGSLYYTNYCSCGYH